MKVPGLILAGTLIIITNTIVLLGVARNRAGTPRQSIQLTEAEAPREFRGKEDSGVSLRLQWERFGPFSTDQADQYAWLDHTKLEELGFDPQSALSNPLHPPLERTAFLALEYNGPAWEQWLKTAEKEPRTQQAYVPLLRSRLFVIDAARRPEPLLEKYNAPGRYIIVRGVVRMFAIRKWDRATQKAGAYRLQASVSRLLPETIHVPPPLSDALAGYSTDSNHASARYTITLSYGRRFEPRIVTSASGQ